MDIVRGYYKLLKDGFEKLKYVSSMVSRHRKLVANFLMYVKLVL